MPEHVCQIAEQAAMLGGPSAGLLVINAAWAGCRWCELAGLQRDHVDLDRRVIVITPEFGALLESAHGLWLGPSTTPASARTIILPRFWWTCCASISPARPAHSHKTWLIADKIPEIAQAQRLGHHLSNRLAEVYSHVAPEIETDLLKALEQRWQYAHQTRRPTDNGPRRTPSKPRPAKRAPHTAPRSAPPANLSEQRPDRSSPSRTAPASRRNRSR